MRKTCRYEPVSSGLSYCIARGTFPAATAVPPSHRPLRLHQPTTADTSPPSPSKVAPDADADAEGNTKLVYRSATLRSSDVTSILGAKSPWLGTSPAVVRVCAIVIDG